MRIAIEGCTHGELDQIYATIKDIEDQQGYKVDLLITCGDFQSTRNLSDLKCMACPDKYKDMCSFYKYYSGEKIAPMLTIFIGGNHEASNYLQELAYGGWVAPNIYYLGYAGVIDINGVRIGGLSGIFKGFDYLSGHYERPPYDDNTMRSCYHIRNVEIFRLKQLEGNAPDIMLSHDWPRSVTKHGNAEQLVRFKKHFKDEIESDKLGSGPTKEVLDVLQPEYWFAAHLHCKFAALVEHPSGAITKFLALDKCLQGRRFLQLVEVGEPVKDDDIILKYDAHWLAVLKSTNHLLSVEKKSRYTPGPGCTERYDFKPTEQEIQKVMDLFGNDLEIPYNFEQSALAYKPNGKRPNFNQVAAPQAMVNRQTTEFCSKLGILDPMALLLGINPPPPTSSRLTSYVNARETNISFNSTINPDEISINEGTEDEEVFVESVKEAEPPKPPTLQFNLPEPKLDSDDVDLVSVLDTSADTAADKAKEEEEHKDKNLEGLFFLDKAGEQVPEEPETPDPPVKKLKRRNMAMYTPDDN